MLSNNRYTKLHIRVLVSSHTTIWWTGVLSATFYFPWREWKEDWMTQEWSWWMLEIQFQQDSIPVVPNPGKSSLLPTVSRCWSQNPRIHPSFTPPHSCLSRNNPTNKTWPVHPLFISAPVASCSATTVHCVDYCNNLWVDLLSLLFFKRITIGTNFVQCTSKIITMYSPG